MHDKNFMRETLLQGAQAFQAGKLQRRSFLALCGMAGFASASVLAGRAEAAAGEIVMWNWGGQSEECHQSAIGAAFTKDTGVPLKFDTSGPLQGKIKEMVDSGNVTADVCDADLFDAVALGKTGHLEALDYSVIDKAKTIDGYALEFGISIILYGYAFMYDTQAYPDGPPTPRPSPTNSSAKWPPGQRPAAIRNAVSSSTADPIWPASPATPLAVPVDGSVQT